jgi:hypothetical protein
MFGCSLHNFIFSLYQKVLFNLNVIAFFYRQIDELRSEEKAFENSH